MTFGELPNLSAHEFLHMQNGDRNGPDLRGYPEELLAILH